MDNPNPLICDHCGHETIYYLHCKIRCSHCGLMLDCSDLDVGGEVQRASQQSSKQILTPKSHPFAHNRP